MLRTRLTVIIVARHTIRFTAVLIGQDPASPFLTKTQTQAEGHSERNSREPQADTQTSNLWELWAVSQKEQRKKTSQRRQERNAREVRSVGPDEEPGCKDVRLVACACHSRSESPFVDCTHSVSPPTQYQLHTQSNHRFYCTAPYHPIRPQDE